MNLKEEKSYKRSIWQHNFIGSFSSWTEILWQFKPFLNLKIESYLEHLNGFLLWFESMCLFITDFPSKLESHSEHLNCFNGLIPSCKNKIRTSVQTVLSSKASLTIWTLGFLIFINHWKFRYPLVWIFVYSGLTFDNHVNVMHKGIMSVKFRSFNKSKLAEITTNFFGQ